MSGVEFDKPRRKSVLLSPEALRDLRSTAARRRTERKAIEEALRLLAEKARAEEILSSQRCALTGTSDVVDARLAVLADQLDVKVLTTDATDFRRLGVDAAEL